MANIDSDKLLELVEEFNKTDGKLTSVNIKNIVQYMIENLNARESEE